VPVATDTWQLKSQRYSLDTTPAVLRADLQLRRHCSPVACRRMLTAALRASRPVRLLPNLAHRAMTTPAAAVPAPPTHVKVALCQILTPGDKAASLKIATDAIAEAAAAGAQIIALPECFNRCGRGAARRAARWARAEAPLVTAAAPALRAQPVRDGPVPGPRRGHPALQGGHRPGATPLYRRALRGRRGARRLPRGRCVGRAGVAGILHLGCA
jgi:hypothetical protein